MSFVDRVVRVLEEVGARLGGEAVHLQTFSIVLVLGIVRADRAGAQLAQMLERVDAGRVSVAPVGADCIPTP